MKLLFDENLSPRLPELLSAEFPESRHVRDEGLKGADDLDIWRHAARTGLVIVTKDDDFRELSIVLGPPPKLGMLSFGNCSTFDVQRALVRQRENIQTFLTDPVASMLELA